MTLPPERCAPASERRGDPLFATAAPAERFVLVEQPGAWGRNALRESRLRTSIVADLLARCHAAGARLLLVRRAHRPTTARSWAIADARPGSEATWWGTFDEDDELDELDPLAPTGTSTTRPTFLVCTHGRRDACCAGRGWPVAVALTERFPEQTWQCSHVGGDRFAANVVVLPHGFYYGRVTPENAYELADRHLDGRVELDLLRGRSCYPPAAQAAQHFVRHELGVDAIDALPPRAVSRTDAETTAVVLGVDDGDVRVLLREHESAPIPRLTCGARSATPIREWELVSIDEA